ncbi:hypothetical protein [Paraflavitalea pollutisoli]|uniref:hypothetical protein n=1 Tax=Paraflavitalea pollutisoli TaxID=3034143 RepID=UPI0023EDF183|nr:hypothetical protein [Paraflavitalea sp. H1-2-19X]
MIEFVFLPMQAAKALLIVWTDWQIKIIAYPMLGKALKHLYPVVYVKWVFSPAATLPPALFASLHPSQQSSFLMCFSSLQRVVAQNF